jgi:hypothetical protein
MHDIINKIRSLEEQLATYQFNAGWFSSLFRATESIADDRSRADANKAVSQVREELNDLWNELEKVAIK